MNTRPDGANNAQAVDAESYALALMTEECGEWLSAANLNQRADEAGDIIAAIRYARTKGIGRADRVPSRWQEAQPLTGNALLTKAVGTLLEAVGKAGRFGLDSPDGPGTDATARDRLRHAMIEAEAAALYCDRTMTCKIIERASRKLAKLLNPDSRDLLGRRLAP
jgi:hypothetical protein